MGSERTNKSSSNFEQEKEKKRRHPEGEAELFAGEPFCDAAFLCKSVLTRNGPPAGSATTAGSFGCRNQHGHTQHVFKRSMHTHLNKL